MNIHSFKLPVLVASLLFILITVAAPAQEDQIKSNQRRVAENILEDVKQDLKENYYDPSFHGMDIEKRFKQAEEDVKKATSFNQALGAVAWFLEPLSDSHTFFVPPPRNYHLNYGFSMQMIAQQCFVTAVKPGTDAEKQDVKPGDLVQSVNGIAPTRDNLWKLLYLFNALRPQPGLHVAFLTPNKQQRVLNIRAEVIPSQSLVTMINFDNEISDYKVESKAWERRFFKVGTDITICKLPNYDLEAYKVDEIIKKTKQQKAMIFDLRGNPGGRVDAVGRMMGEIFDHDVTVGSIKERKKTQPEIIKTHGAKSFRGKVIVLIDSKSASAAEIFARVIQLEKRGIVIGDLTEGAVMQSQFYPHMIPDNFRSLYFGTSISMAEVIMKDGKSLEHTGVVPDEEIIPTAEDLRSGRDPVLSRAVALAGGTLSPEEAGKIFPVIWPIFKP